MPTTSLGIRLFDDNEADISRAVNDALQDIDGILLTLKKITLAGGAVGKPTASAILLHFIATDAFTLPAGLTGSRGDSEAAATANTVFSLRKNGGAAAGTITFATGATSATFAAASATSFAPGDVLTVTAPGTPDATLADLALTLVGNLA